MGKIDEQKLLDILLSEQIIAPEDARACQFYQQQHLEQRGESIELPKVLEKLEILSASKLDSIVRALESTQVAESTPVFTSSGAVIKDKDAPNKVAQASLNILAPKKKKSLSVRKDLEEDENLEESLPLPEEEEVKSIERKGPAKPRIKLPAMEERPSYSEEGEKSIFTAYLALIFTGIFGGHRYYLRSYQSAIWYSLTAGFLGIGVVIDLFLLPWLVIRYNRNEAVESEFAAMNQYTTVGEIPEWCEQQTSFGKFKAVLEFICQLLLVAAIPLALVATAVLFWQPWLPLIFALVIIVYYYHPVFTNKLHQQPSLSTIPVFEFLVANVDRSKGFYYQNSPLPVIAYLFYPLWMPFAALLSNKRRQESYLYIGFVIAIVAAIVCGSLWTYCSLSSTANIDINAVINSHISLWILCGIVSLALLVTFITSLTSWNLQAKQKLVSAGSFWGVGVGIIGCFILCSGYFISAKEYSHQYAKKRLQARLTSPTFCKELRQVSKTYLLYVTERHLFNIQSTKLQELNSGNLSSGLIKDFKEKGIALAEDSHIAVKLKDVKWLITDSNHFQYSIINDKGFLRVYAQQPKTGDNKALHHFVRGLMTTKEAELFSWKIYLKDKDNRIFWIDTDLGGIIAIDHDLVVWESWKNIVKANREKILTPSPMGNLTYLQPVYEYLNGKGYKRSSLILDRIQESTQKKEKEEKRKKK